MEALIYAGFILLGAAIGYWIGRALDWALDNWWWDKKDMY